MKYNVMNWIRFDSLGLFGIHNYRRIKLLKTIPEKTSVINCETSLAKVIMVPDFLNFWVILFFCQVVLTPIVVWHASFFLLSQTLFIVSLCNNQLLYLIEKELIWIFGHIPGFSATLPSMIAKLHAAKDKYLSPPAPVSPYSQMEVSTFSLNLWPFDFELEWPVLRALNYSSHFLSPCLVWT